MDLEKAISKINCSNPKKLKEHLLQYGSENNNLKSEIKLMSAVIDKCGIGGGKVKKNKKDGPKKPLKEGSYAKHIKDCWDVHRDKKLGFNKTNEICRLEWKQKKGS